MTMVAAKVTARTVVYKESAVAQMTCRYMGQMVVAVVAVLPIEAVAAASALAVNDTSWDEPYAHVYDVVGIIEMSSHTFSLTHMSSSPV